MAENGKAKYYTLMEEMKTDILSGKIRPELIIRGSSVKAGA